MFLRFTYLTYSPWHGVKVFTMTCHPQNVHRNNCMNIFSLQKKICMFFNSSLLIKVHVDLISQNLNFYSNLSPKFATYLTPYWFVPSVSMFTSSSIKSSPSCGSELVINKSRCNNRPFISHDLKKYWIRCWLLTLRSDSLSLAANTSQTSLRTEFFIIGWPFDPRHSTELSV